jgi:Bacterial Ig-like domain (group 2)
MNAQPQAFDGEGVYGGDPAMPSGYEGRVEAGGQPADRPMRVTERAPNPGHEGKRMGRVEMALAGTAVLNQVQHNFPAETANPAARVVLPLAPLLLLTPERRGIGDPRLLGGVAIVGLAIASQLRAAQGPGEPTAVTIVRSAMMPLQAKEKDWFRAEARDRRGRAVDGQAIEWKSSDEEVATVDGATGEVTAVGPGSARITATADGTPSLSDSATVIVR